MEMLDSGLNQIFMEKIKYKFICSRTGSEE